MQGLQTKARLGLGGVFENAPGLHSPIKLSNFPNRAFAAGSDVSVSPIQGVGSSMLAMQVELAALLQRQQLPNDAPVQV